MPDRIRSTTRRSEIICGIDSWRPLDTTRASSASPSTRANLRTQLFRDQSAAFRALTHPVNYPPINGAYTELWAGLSPEVTTLAGAGSSCVAPFGRFYPVRPDLEAAAKHQGEEGGDGSTAKFWDWSEAQVKQFIKA
ncbi:hypothetical protein F4778DRAFT_781051 [Xylariomycetidae sp. FL2044]|nr:hypothetical protein F4778DRAFT_781051 [Xylariomycetidae sp. FL2044]